MTELTWSDDRTEMLKKLWEAGLSCSQIACELGGVTRNAVIGKVHRLGLSGRIKSPSSAAPRPRKARLANHEYRAARIAARSKTTLAEAFEVGTEESAPIVYDNIVPLEQRISLAGLTDATCHWPIGNPADVLKDDGSFFFCGGKSLTGLPYCAQHSRIAYQPTADRRRAPAKPGIR